MTPGEGRVDDRWDSPRFRERDTPWAAGCRLLQGWWREEVLHAPPGPMSPSKPDRFVVSMLPLGADPSAQFLTPEAEDAVVDRLAEGNHSGIIDEDRLYRNLLSSQPLCFNLLGPFVDEPAALLAWVATIDEDATEVRGVRFEWAPPREQHFGGGSAFDAFVTYDAGGSSRFLGVECKYAENLRQSSIEVRQPYRAFTEEHPGWRPGASERLDEPHLRQAWLNTLLVQSLAANDDRFDSGTCIVLSCGADMAAEQAVEEVRANLVGPDGWLRWCAYERLLSAVGDRARQWADRFERRYLDFSPVAHLLDPNDPRQEGNGDGGLATALTSLLAVVTRVLGDGSVVKQVIDAAEQGTLVPSPGSDADLAVRAERVTDDLRLLREDLEATHRRIGRPGA